MRSRSRASAALVLALTTVLAPALAVAAKVETWRHETGSAFAKGKKEHLVVSDAGKVRLARALKPVGTIDAAHVWKLARAANGSIYAATGNAGRIYRRETKGEWELAYDASDTQVLSLAVLPDGRVFAGTGPSGQVIDLTDPKHPATRPDPSVNYVWDLAADTEGNLFAATGPTGQLWKRSADGKWKLLLDSKHPHLLCVAVGPDGSIFAGSDGEGLIYKVTKDGVVSVLYDAPQNEVRTLLVAPDGALFAGTAAESGGGSGSGPTRGLSFAGTPAADAEDGRVAASIVRASFEPAQAKRPARPADAPAGGTAAPRPPSPGDNAVYRLSPDGAPREIFRARTMIFALAWQEDRLYVGTGPEGLLYEVRDLGRESAPIARLDSGQILSLLADPHGDLLIGTGEPGTVQRLTSGHASSGTLTSEVLDTKLVSRFGALSWKADVPAGTTVSAQVRTGNVGEPDATWSPWSSSQAEPGPARASVPTARFAQYRVTLSSDEAKSSPELRSISLHYQTVNQPPEITRVTVPDLSEGDGTARPGRLSLRWDASDPNGDDLAYTLYLRKDGWPDWIKLTSEPISEKTFSWDATSVPPGTYRLRVSASDRPSNAPADAIVRELTSESFLVDHQAPGVEVSARPEGASVTIKDDLTRIVKASYALDGGEWMPIFPDDGLFDTPREVITIKLPDLKPGTHVLMVRATDAAGNVGAGDAVLKGPSAP